MAEPKKTKNAKNPGIGTRIKKWCKGVKAEFQKIIWPTQEKIYKDTVTVVTATVCLGVIIALFDMVLQYGMKLLIG
ncbi:MAG: preprotein translocase subunit SecE [Lachnospiraceae bacterium]|nr:preprotein translocase subunit SecE [Lachnospiraceae bacterium]